MNKFSEQVVSSVFLTVGVFTPIVNKFSEQVVSCVFLTVGVVMDSEQV